MEIIQTIWKALITQNEILTNIITTFLMFIELTVSMLLFTTVLNISSNKTQKIQYVCFSSLIGVLTMWLVPVPFNTFINILACPILVYLIFKANIIKSILAQIVTYISFLIIVPILLSIYINVLGINSNILIVTPLYKTLYSLSLYVIIYLIYKLFSKFNINIKLINSIKLQKINYRLLVNFVVGIIALCIQGYLVNMYIDFIPLWLNLLSITMSIIYFFISIYSLLRTNKLEITTQNLEEEKLYNKTLTILYDNIRTFKHDFNNIVQAIGGYISTNNMEGLKAYHSDLMKDCKRVNNLDILNPKLINSPAIYSLLTSKYYKAEELGIKMNIDVLLDLQILNIKAYDLTRILGVLLDNAIEASNNCKDKEINITICKDHKIDRQLFIIENTYSNKDVNIDRIFEKGYTTKQLDDKQNHGLGLWSVKQIIKKNNNLNLYTTKDKKLFKQQLEIYY